MIGSLDTTCTLLFCKQRESEWRISPNWQKQRGMEECVKWRGWQREKGRSKKKKYLAPCCLCNAFYSCIFNRIFTIHGCQPLKISRHLLSTHHSRVKSIEVIISYKKSYEPRDKDRRVPVRLQFVASFSVLLSHTCCHFLTLLWTDPNNAREDMTLLHSHTMPKATEIEVGVKLKEKAT